jgi:hypothetical protein
MTPEGHSIVTDYLLWTIPIDYGLVEYIKKQIPDIDTKVVIEETQSNQKNFWYDAWLKNLKTNSFQTL